MKCFLSGMPDVKLGLNDKLEVRVVWLEARFGRREASPSLSVRAALHEACVVVGWYC